MACWNEDQHVMLNQVCNANLKRHLQLNPEIKRNELKSEREETSLTFNKNLIIQSSSSHSYQQWLVIHNIPPALVVVNLNHLPLQCGQPRDPKITASLNRLRCALRQSATKLENYIKQGASEDIVGFETKLTKVDTIRKKLLELQKRYYELPSEADLTETDEAIEQMETSLEEMEATLKYLISKRNIDDKSTKLNIKGNKTQKLLSVKLLDSPLPQFSGKYEDFGNFKSQFISLIEDNDGLSNAQKLYYLESLLTGEGKLIQTTDDTYEWLLKSIEDRHENKRAIIDSQILGLINLEKFNFESAEDLRKSLEIIKIM
ncbi:hypothetical protein AVEN_240242-1 [Araneus ventricosus]|uniref:Uncharacterized protein n=1 Tax=Araneus ventricosus TaxID=182803 RepID=A0A4Y2W5S8_ARAVE|nr:hypothetical protein AVEN_193538-1 [Araneus ventricosus]GBO31888.1 hypothetical protein AVEN_240242-1 [Araneus ventricosus]